VSFCGLDGGTTDRTSITGLRCSCFWTYADRAKAEGRKAKADMALDFGFAKSISYLSKQ
jgi:hypothetical protein